MKTKTNIKYDIESNKWVGDLYDEETGFCIKTIVGEGFYELEKALEEFLKDDIPEENQEASFIRQQVSKSSILLQIAEEASEVAQAALKLNRAYLKDNPTPMSVEKCEKNLIEEINDLDLVNKIFSEVDLEKNPLNDTQKEKLARWCRRIRESHEKKK